MKLLNIILLLVLAGVGVTFANVERKRDWRTNRYDSAGNLKQLGVALLMYSGDYSGVFPNLDGEAGLNILSKTGYLKAGKVYINPGDKQRTPVDDVNAELSAKTCSYAYLGAGLRDDNARASTMPLMWEKPYGDSRVNVLFIDGHVESQKGTFKTNADIARDLGKRHGWGKDTVTFYVEKATAIDKKGGLSLQEIPRETKEKLEALVAQLGAESFKERRAAQKALEAYLPDAYQFLELKLEKSDDPEVKTRIKALLK